MESTNEILKVQMYKWWIYRILRCAIDKIKNNNTKLQDLHLTCTKFKLSTLPKVKQDEYCKSENNKTKIGSYK